MSDDFKQFPQVLDVLLGHTAVYGLYANFAYLGSLVIGFVLSILASSLLFLGQLGSFAGALKPFCVLVIGSSILIIRYSSVCSWNFNIPRWHRLSHWGKYLTLLKHDHSYLS